MAQKDIGNKVPLHTLKKVEDVAAYYDEWALNNKYDKDMEAWNYTGPKETSETFNKYQNNKNIEKEKPVIASTFFSANIGSLVGNPTGSTVTLLMSIPLAVANGGN